MAVKLSRVKRYETLRNRLDEETTAAQEDKINQETGFARLSRTQHKNLAHATDGKATAPLYSSSEATNTKSPVIEDLLGEVKQYNIEQGNRVTDDTQINILRQLEPTEEHPMHRNTHIVPMEEEEPAQQTMKREKPNVEEVDGVAMYMPNQKLTRINPVQTSVPEELKTKEEEYETEKESGGSTYTNVILGSDDILADDTVDTDHLSVLGPKDRIIPEVEEEPVRKEKRQKPKKERKPKKKVSDSQEMPSAKIRMSTRDIEDMEQEPKSKFGMIINVILVVLVILLIVSLAFVFYFITQLGA